MNMATFNRVNRVRISARSDIKTLACYREGQPSILIQVMIDGPYYSAVYVAWHCQPSQRLGGTSLHSPLETATFLVSLLARKLASISAPSSPKLLVVKISSWTL